jgi:hypothetical protein
MSSHNLNVALRWATAGAHILVTGPDKRARIKWRALSTTNAEVIRSWFAKWPDSLPAIDLAKSDFIVLDGDRHGGADGVAAVEQMLAEHNLNGAAIPTVITPQDGRHYWFRQPTDGEPLGNSDKAVRQLGINIRGAGGYVIAPGTVLSNGKRYQRDLKTPSAIASTRDGTIPVLPPALVSLLRNPNQHDRVAMNSHKTIGHDPHSGLREEAYAQATLVGLSSELATMAPGTGRNNKLNECALRRGHMIASGWIGRSAVERGLLDAATAAGW